MELEFADITKKPESEDLSGYETVLIIQDGKVRRVSIPILFAELIKGITGGNGSVDLSGYAKVEQIPKNTSDLNNDSGFITRMVMDLVNYYAKSETYNREEIDQKISAIPKFSIAVVDALPSEDISDTTIYLLKDSNDSGNLYTEHIWTDGKWETLGSQRVDLTGYAKEIWVTQLLAGYQPKGNYLVAVPEGYAKTEDIPTKPEDIGAQPAGNYALKDEMPVVPVQSVNGKTGAVQLNAADVGARPSNWMPTAQEVGALPDTYVPPNQTAAQVGADPAGTAAAAVGAHNTSTESHGDLRLELKAINDRLTTFFDCDDTTLDELSEIVASITSNKTLIDSITTSKVSVADIINNLTTNVANKPLSAAQGVALKGLIDAVSSSLSNYQPKGDYALRSELPTVPTKVSQLQNDKGYLTEHQDISGKLDADKLPEAVNAALAQAKDSGEFDGDPGAPGKDGTSVTVKSVSESTEDGGSNVVAFSDGETLNVKNGKAGTPGKTPVRGTDYWTDADQQEILDKLSAQAAALRDLAFAPVPQLPADGRVKGENMGGGTTITPNFTNLIAADLSNVQLNKRVSSSDAIKDANGNICIDYFQVAEGDIIRVNLPSVNFSTNYTRIIFYDGNQNNIRLSADALPIGSNPDENVSGTIKTVDGVTSFVVPGYISKYGGTPTKMRMNLWISSSAVTADDIAGLIVTKNQEITYTEINNEVIADVSADFDVKTVKSTDIYSYVDAVAAKYPGYIARENLGKDQSGMYDINRYVLNGQRYYLAWQRQNYPKMYAWGNGSTTIYSVSVSPRVGDTMYSTKYIGTAYGTVSSVNYTAQGVTPKAASTRTVGGKVFTRKPESDVEPTLVYTLNLPEYGVAPASVGARIRAHGGAVQKVITAVGDGTITGDSSTVYIRYPLGDCNSDWERPVTVTIWANEHQDTPEPAIIMARFIKDLAENTNNGLLHYLKNNVQLVIIPVLNPHGYNWQITGTQYGDGYYNVNNVNINRNYDTPGWAEGPYDTGTGALGSYPGSEVETQYAMNTLQLSKAAVGMSLHTVGYLDATGTIDNPASNGLCHYQGDGFDAVKIAKIAQVMWSNYNLLFTDYGRTPPSETGKSPAYINYAGCIGGLVEMQPREGINPVGTDGSPLVMEACYTEFLQCLYMWLTDCMV